MSISKKNPLKRDQALNDTTSGQMGEEHVLLYLLDYFRTLQSVCASSDQ